MSELPRWSLTRASTVFFQFCCQKLMFLKMVSCSQICVPFPRTQIIFNCLQCKTNMAWAVQSMYHFTNNTYSATHCCIFKSTALCEGVLHYNENTTKYEQILCRFKKKFFERQKKLLRTFFLKMFGTWSGKFVRWVTPNFNCFTCKWHTKLQWTPCFSHSSVSLLFKRKVPKVLWEKGTSRPRKEPRSDPASCLFMWDVTIYPVLVVPRTVGENFKFRKLASKDLIALFS